jgi:peptidoglycan/LPS O-acetylase OafA/YrhL
MVGSYGPVTAADGDIKATVPPGGRQDYYPWFDWLRLGLALVVLFYHEGLLKQPNIGNLAVQVFFALSGWLIGGILLDLPPKELPRFYFNRALRIWSPYFLAVALLLAASVRHDQLTRKWGEFVFYYLTFVYNIFGTRQLWNHLAQMPLQGTGNHFWSVNAEEQFYLIAPLLLVLLPRRIGRNIGFWILLAIAAFASNMYASITLGVLAVLIAHSLGPFQESNWFRPGAGLVAALCGYGIASGANYNLLAPLFAISIVLLLAIKGRRHPFGELAGGLSYPLYLNQWTAWFVLKAMLNGRRLPFMGTFITIPASLIFSALLYWYFDRVILANRRRLYSPRRGRIIMTIAYALIAAGLCGGLLRWRHA